jgi:hypothetical protein
MACPCCPLASWLCPRTRLRRRGQQGEREARRRPPPSCLPACLPVRCKKRAMEERVKGRVRSEGRNRVERSQRWVYTETGEVPGGPPQYHYYYSQCQMQCPVRPTRRIHARGPSTRACPHQAPQESRSIGPVGAAVRWGVVAVGDGCTCARWTFRQYYLLLLDFKQTASTTVDILPHHRP